MISIWPIIDVHFDCWVKADLPASSTVKIESVLFHTLVTTSESLSPAPTVREGECQGLFFPPLQLVNPHHFIISSLLFTDQTVTS